MEKREFSKAVNAYVKHKANSWQEFIVEDYYDSFKYAYDIMELYSERKIARIRDRIFARIMKTIRDNERKNNLQ